MTIYEDLMKRVANLRLAGSRAEDPTMAEFWNVKAAQMERVANNLPVSIAEEKLD